MPKDSMNTQNVTPPLFQLSALFDPNKVRISPLQKLIIGDESPNWTADGLDINPMDKATKEAIILSLFQDEVSPKIEFSNGSFISVISAPEIFHLICSKIDELRPINSPEEFFYNVIAANGLFEMFIEALSHNPIRQGGKDQRL